MKTSFLSNFAVLTPLTSTGLIIAFLFLLKTVIYASEPKNLSDFDVESGVNIQMPSKINPRPTSSPEAVYPKPINTGSLENVNIINSAKPYSEYNLYLPDRNQSSFVYQYQKSFYHLITDSKNLGTNIFYGVNNQISDTWEFVKTIPNKTIASIGEELSTDRKTFLGRDVTGLFNFINAIKKQIFGDFVINSRNGFNSSYEFDPNSIYDNYGNLKNSKTIFDTVITLNPKNLTSRNGFNANIPKGVDPYNRNIFIEQIKSGNGDIIITAHGWNNSAVTQNADSFKNLNYMKPFAYAIANSQYDPSTGIRISPDNSSVLAINWMEASSFELTGSSRYDNQHLMSVENAAIWITPTAKSIAKYLSDSNTDISRVVLDGHSLGAYLSYKVVEEYQKLHPDKKAKAILILDIAAELKDSTYDLDGNTKGVQGIKDLNFKSKFDNVLRLTGINSYAGDTKVDFDTDFSLGVDYGTKYKETPGTKESKAVDLGAEHSQIPETIKNAYINNIEIPVDGITNALDPKNARSLNDALLPETNSSPRFLFDNMHLIYDGILIAKQRYYASGVYNDTEVQDQKALLAKTNSSSTDEQSNVVNASRENTNYSDSAKTSTPAISPSVIPSKFDVNNVNTYPKDKDIPMAIAVKTSVPDELKNNSKCNTSNTYTVYDSNKGNKVLPYSVINSDLKSTCSVLKSDGNKDTVVAVDNVPTVMYGEGDDDLFDLSKVGDNAEDIYVKDFGVGGDKIMLNIKYKGMYRFDKKDDGSVNIVLDDKFTGSENLIIANVTGSKVAAMLQDSDPFNNSLYFLQSDKNEK